MKIGMSAAKSNSLLERIEKMDFRLLVLFCFAGTAYIIYKVNSIERTLISLSTTALMLGLFAESLRLGGFKKKVLSELLLAYALSFIVFIPLNFDDYNLYNRIATWPAVFLGANALTSMVLFKDKIIPKINISHTSVWSLAIFYYVYDWGLLQDKDWIYRILGYLLLALSIFVLIVALQRRMLSQRQRVLLSSWSALIMIFFAADYALNLFLSTKYASEISIMDKVMLFVPYFVLGMGLVYVLQNIYLVYDFIAPENSEYKEQVKRVVATHLKRYDPKKPRFIFLFIFIIATIAFFWTNHRFDFLSKQTSVWLVFLLVSVLNESRYRSLEKRR